MKSWYRIQNKADDVADILIYEQIGKSFWDDSGVSAKEFVQDLSALKVDRINLSINSPGGSVFDGNSIYNALKAHRAKVHVKVDGIAASIASVIAMAGDTIEMPENAMMMIHDPWGFAMGTADDMLKQAEALEKIKVGLVAAYAGRTGRDRDEINDMMSKETWMTAEEAVSLGFADKMLAPVAAQANFDMLAQFRNLPDNLRAGEPGKDGDAMGNTPKPPEITLDHIRAEYPAIVQALVEEGKEAGKEMERSRIDGILDQSYPGCEDIISDAIKDGKSTAGDVAMKINARNLDAQNRAKKDLSDDAPAPVVEQPHNSELPTDGPMTEEKAKAMWAKNVGGCQSEYMRFEDFLAYHEDNPHVIIKNKGE